MARGKKNRGPRKKQTNRSGAQISAKHKISTSSMPIPTITDPLLARILFTIPLQKLVILRLVSSQWKRVIETEIFASKLTVKLYGYKLVGAKQTEEDV